MGISKEFLLESAGLLATVVLIGIGVGMLHRSDRFADELEKKQNDAIRQEQEYDLTKYDGVPINGSMALNHVKQVVAEYKVTVTVVKGSNEYVVASSEQFADMRKLESPLYLNPLKEYVGSVKRDANDVIIEIRLEEQP